MSLFRRFCCLGLLSTVAGVLVSGCDQKQSTESHVQSEEILWLLEQALLSPSKARCAYEPLGENSNEVYVWAFCESTGEVTTGVSVPVALQLGRNGLPVSLRTPRDGSLYAKDLENIFPADLIPKISTATVKKNQRVERLQEILARRKEQHSEGHPTAD